MLDDSPGDHMKSAGPGWSKLPIRQISRVYGRSPMLRMRKEAFCVIGKVGSTNDGPDFVQKLWGDANGHFDEVASLAVYHDNGTLAGIWGAMTNFAFDFQPWEEDFSKGLYLAGVEARTDAVPPRGWKKWIVPGFEYLKVEVTGEDTFPSTIAYMRRNHIPLAGAVQDFTDPVTGKGYMLFPVAADESKLKLIQEVKTTISPYAACGLHCDYCFLTQWCGGCRSACNMCAYATLSEDNICPNLSCSKAKGLDGCYQCEQIMECDKGFYCAESDGANAAKAMSIFMGKHGKEAVASVLDKLHEKYDFKKLQEVLDEDVDKSVRVLETLI